MNLSDLSKPPVMTIEPFGSVQIDVYGSLRSWFDDWLKRPNPTGSSLVRALLLEQVSHSGEPPSPLDGSAIAAANMDSVADAILSALGGYFRPKFIATPETGSRRKVRKRGEAELYDLAAQEGESGADRLLRVLTAWHQDRRDADWMFAAPTRLLAAETQRAFGGALEFQKMIDQQKALAISPAYELAMKNVRSFSDDHLAAIRGSALGIGAALAQSSLPAPFLADVINKTRAIDAASMARFPEMGAAFRQMELRAARSLGDVGGFKQLQDTVQSFRQLLGTTHVMGQGWRDQFEFARNASRLFDLHIPAATLAAIAAFPAHEVLNSGASAMRSSFFPPGYQMVAAVGMESMSARGAVSDILRMYGQEHVADAPVFGGALDGLSIIDAEPDDPAEAVSHLERFAALVMSLLAGERDPIRLGGLLKILGLIATVVGAYYAYAAVELSHGATTADVEAVGTRLNIVGQEITGMRNEIAGLRADRSDELRHVRYLHDRAPLRAEPHGKAHLIRMVYPDQPVRVLEQRGEWVSVEVFDYKSDGITRGWIARSRLRVRPLE